MNFTREPIIETVITPREGCKLVVRNSKGNGQEDYFVDAVEVVSFGHSFFFRSLERPKSFLVPVSDYEILELKETRIVLKNAATERSIKIGGGREAPFRPQREGPPSEEAGEGQPPLSERGKRDNKRRRSRRGRERPEPPQPPQDFQEPLPEEPLPLEEMEAPLEDQEVRTPSFISKLFPPPPTLIKETLSRYKPVEPTQGEEDVFSQPPEANPDESLLEPPPPSAKEEEESEGETHFED